METFLTSVVVFGIVFLIVAHPLFFSRMARDTRELARMNRIWEKFNDGMHPDEVENLLNERAWKYHRDKANMLRTFIHLKRKQNV